MPLAAATAAAGGSAHLLRLIITAAVAAQIDDLSFRAFLIAAAAEVDYLCRTAGHVSQYKTEMRPFSAVGSESVSSCSF